MNAVKNIEKSIEKLLTTVIDFFYPPFRKVMSLELFRYGCCGGLNLALEWVLYYVHRINAVLTAVDHGLFILGGRIADRYSDHESVDL